MSNPAFQTIAADDLSNVTGGKNYTWSSPRNPNYKYGVNDDPPDIIRQGDEAKHRWAAKHNFKKKNGGTK